MCSMVREVNKERQPMIGELINKFEELDNQTVETFNDIFKNNQITGYDKDCQVEIGELANTSRKITINGKDHFWHDMAPAKQDYSFDARGTCNAKQIKLYTPEKVFIGEFDSIQHAAFFLNISREKLNYRISTNKYIREEV